MSEIQISTEQTTSAERARAQGKPVELPADYNEYLVVSLWMKTTQLWAWLKQRVLARRAGAYELCVWWLPWWRFSRIARLYVL